MTTHTRRRLSMAALLLLVPTTAACGFGAQTDQSYQSSWGTDNRSGQIYILNSVVVSAKNGTGTWAGTLVDNSDSRGDKLVSITGSKGTVSVPVPAGGTVNLAKTGQVQLTGKDLAPGNFVELTMTFSSGQSTKVDTPVYPNTGDYAKVPVGGNASAKPSKAAKGSTKGAKATKAKAGATASATPSAKPSSSATASPSASASPSK